MKKAHNYLSLMLPILFALLLFATKAQAQTQKSTDLFGKEADDEFGFSVSMPDINTVAIGAPGYGENYREFGHVRIYRWKDSVWEQKGADINGEASGDRSGSSVSMPDANTLAIGAPTIISLNAGRLGDVRIYGWNGVAWKQKGTDIKGKPKVRGFGWSVSMPDSNTLAIGAPGNGINGVGGGQVKIFHWKDSVWVQKGKDIIGESKHDRSGNSVSMPDANTVAIGAPLADSYVTKKTGRLRVYSICDQHPDTTKEVHTACDSFNWIDGQTYTSTTQSPTHTLVNAEGCDSLISLDLTIRHSTGRTDLVRACDSFTWIDNQTYRASTNSPTFTLINSMACDSVVSLDLTIVNLDTSITKNEASLVSNQAGASYRWLNCDSSFTAVNGAVNQEFIPSKSGFYACEISLDGCVDTTACVQFSVRSENEASSYKLYPNPFAGELTIEACGDTQENTSIKVMNIHGQVILARTASMGKTVLYNKDWAKGVYLVQLTNREGIVNTYRLVHQ